MFAIFSAFGMVCYIMSRTIFLVHGMIIFFISDKTMYLYELKYVKIYYYHLSEQYQGIQFYIFILIFLSKYIHLLSVVFTTYEKSQTVKIVNPLLYEYAAVKTIAF